MNDQSRNRSVVAAHSLSSDARLRWDLSLRLQFWRCRRLKPKPLLRPRRPRRRPQMRRSLARSADRNGDPGERNGVKNDAQDAQSGVRSGEPDATSDGTRATAPPQAPRTSRKSNLSSGPNSDNGPPQGGPQQPKGRTAPRQRRAKHRASRGITSSGPAPRSARPAHRRCVRPRGRNLGQGTLCGHQFPFCSLRQ